MQQRAKEAIPWLSKNNMPYPECRNDHSWVDPYNHCTGLKNQLEKLNLELEEIRKLPPALADVERSFVESFKNHQEFTRNKELQTFIKINYGHPDPIDRLRFLHPDNLLRTPEISLTEWEKAFADLEKSWPKEAITAAARKKRRNEIRKKIDAIGKELAQYPEFEKWQEFVGHWSSLQSKCDAACNPQAFSLKISPPEEVEAYRKLGLGKLVDPSNRYHPART